jgi:quercetin dioxygenase-like cupin family protein
MRPENQTPFRQQDLFGGQGEVRIWDLFGTTHLPPFESVLACELDPDGSVGAHRQATADEILVILEGQATAGVDGEKRHLEVGSLVALPMGSLMTLKNLDEERPLRYLIIKARRSQS